MKKLVIGLTGASGIRYGIRLLEQTLLRKHYDEVYVIITKAAERVAFYEEGIKNLYDRIREMGYEKIYGEEDWDSPLTSSSSLVDADMVIVPASINTVAKLSIGIQDNVLLRAASAVLRLRGKLVVVVRETPLSTIDLYNLYRLSKAGAIILPASPGFYHAPEKINDLVDFIVGKMLDVLGIESDLYRRWQPR